MRKPAPVDFKLVQLKRARLWNRPLPDRGEENGLGKAISMAPAFFEKYAQDRLPWVRPEDHAHIPDGWRKAGWREG